MDEININKYLSQFNPILVVPVLSAVVGAILVFVFGFKRPTEPRFTTASAIDSIKKSKRKSAYAKNTEITVQSSKQQQIPSSAKVNNTKKASSNNSATPEISILVTGKKTGNNNTINKKKDEKKSEEKKSDSGSPVKKVANAKKTTKESTSNNKKLKVNKKSSSEEHDEMPAGFDGDGWFTVTKKQQKNKNEYDGNDNKGESPSPKQQSSKANNDNKSKGTKVDNKVVEQPVAASTNLSSNEVPAVVQTSGEVEVNEVKPNETESSVEATQVDTVVLNNEVGIVEPIKEQLIEEKQYAKSIPSPVAVNNANATAYSAIAFDELGEWTDAKPDRKKVNKKKLRKD